MTLSIEAGTLAPADQTRPTGDSTSNNDHVRHQAIALLDLARPTARTGEQSQRFLDVSNIDQVVEKSAPHAYQTARSSGPTAERERTAPASRGAHDRTVASDSGPQHHEPPLEPARQHVVDLANDKFRDNPAALNAFKQNMQDFEQRMMRLSPIEVQRTYTQLARMMETSSANVSDADRLLLSQQIMRNAAHPEVGIGQGLSNTCAAASIEMRAYAQAPGEAARMVTDLALTGKFTTSDGRMLAPASGISHGYANDGFNPPGRTFASQIFQVGAMNLYVDMMNQSTNPPGKYRYALGPSTSDLLPYQEHIYNDATHPPTDSPNDGIQPNDEIVSAMYTSITGKNESESILSASSLDSLADFKARLTQANRQGNYPMVLVMNPSSSAASSEMDDLKNSAWYKRFHAEHPDVLPGLSSALHAITIQSYDAKTGRITYTDPEFPEQVRQGDINTMARSMNMTLYPETERSFFDFQEKFPPDQRYTDENILKYLASVPPTQRQAQFDQLAEMNLIFTGTFTRAQLKALGLVDSRPNPYRDDDN